MRAEHRYTLNTHEDGTITGTSWTNDNNDDGYAGMSDDAHWDVSFRNRAEALKHTGGTHQGISCFVIVELDGEIVDREGNKYLYSVDEPEEEYEHDEIDDEGDDPQAWMYEMDNQ